MFIFFILPVTPIEMNFRLIPLKLTSYLGSRAKYIFGAYLASESGLSDRTAEPIRLSLS